MAPTASPCDSPKVVTEKRRPKVLLDMVGPGLSRGSGRAHRGRRPHFGQRYGARSTRDTRLAIRNGGAPRSATTRCATGGPAIAYLIERESLFQTTTEIQNAWRACPSSLHHRIPGPRRAPP